MKNFELLGLSAVFLVVLITGFAEFSSAVGSCNDTDGGLNYGLPGAVTGYLTSNPITYFHTGDWCINRLQLKEAYCNGTTHAYKYVYCADVGFPYGCVTNQNGGYCQSIAPSVRPSPTTTSCFESDGGINYETRGYVDGYTRGWYFNYKDTCVTRQDLREYYCDNGVFKSVIKRCSSPGVSLAVKYCQQTGHPADNGACYTAPAPAPEQPIDQTLLLVAGIIIVVIAIVWFARGKFGKSAKHGKKK
ncbi:MAG: hypothetical protein V1817_00635 [Candidatus Micrarchaeota archaeon]